MPSKPAVKSTRYASEFPPVYNAPFVGSLTVPSTFFQDVSIPPSNMVTGRHNIASRILLKGISKGPLGAALASMDIDSADHLALQDLQIPEHSTNITLPKHILPHRFLLVDISVMIFTSFFGEHGILWINDGRHERKGLLKQRKLSLP
eukprot:1141584-Pelagomonas_calceolata.AAC.1